MIDSILNDIKSEVVNLNIDMTKAPCKAVISEITEACNKAEDAGPQSVLLIHLKGSESASNAPIPTPSNVKMVNQWEKALRRLERVNAITVSMIKGHCNGIGFTLMLATDYRIIERDCNLGLLLDNGGIMPGMTLYRLVNQVGIAWSRKLALLGMEITAEKAHNLGLIDCVADECGSAAAMFLESLTQIDTTELAVRRRLLLDASSTSYEDGVGSHLAACDRYLRKLEAEMAASSEHKLQAAI